MPISFGRKSKLPYGKPAAGKLVDSPAGQGARLHPDCQLLADTKATLVDLRGADAFARKFIPGSYNVPDLACVCAARRNGLFKGRRIYLIADDLEQLQMCSEAGFLGEGAEVAGWFGGDAIEEWQKMNAEIGCLETISSETLSIRVAAWNTLVLDISEAGASRPLSHPSALQFKLEELPVALDGLPVDSTLCLTASSSSVASFAASLLWNFGFHKLSYLSGGCRVPFPTGAGSCA